MGFDAEKHNVHEAGIFQVSHQPGARDEVIIGADHAYAFFLHGAQVRAAGMHCHVISLARHHCANVRSYGSGPHNQEFHLVPPANVSAMDRRWILPVAVRGIFSTIWTFFGTLKSARCSLQCSIRTASVCGSFSTTAIATSSPHVGCGIPNAPASATQGCVIITSSISSGAIFSPPRLINSLMRAVRCRYPSASMVP